VNDGYYSDTAGLVVIFVERDVAVIARAKKRDKPAAPKEGEKPAAAPARKPEDYEYRVELLIDGTDLKKRYTDINLVAPEAIKEVVPKLSMVYDEAIGFIGALAGV
jgi:hypothetical protein